MKVAFVAGAYRPQQCGIAGYTARLRDALADRGIESVVLTDVGAPERGPGVRRVVDAWGARSLPALVAAVRRARADVLHVQHAPGTYGFRRGTALLPPLLRAAGERIPIVTTVHEYGRWDLRLPRALDGMGEWLKQAGQARGWWDREDGFLLTGSDAVVATDDEGARVIRGRLPALDERLFRIPVGPGVEPAAAGDAAAVRARFGWAPDAEVLAFFGFVEPGKGLETLLGGFRRLARRRPEARLLLAGGTRAGGEAYAAEVRRRTEACGLRGRVAVTGWLDADDASRLLAGASAGVLVPDAGVTLRSGALMTMLAHGLPVVATQPRSRVPGLEDAGVRAVPPRDEAALATALMATLADDDARRRRGDAARTFSRAFTWSGIAARHAELYTDIRDARRPVPTPRAIPATFRLRMLRRLAGASRVG